MTSDWICRMGWCCRISLRSSVSSHQTHTHTHTHTHPPPHTHTHTPPHTHTHTHTPPPHTHTGTHTLKHLIDDIGSIEHFIFIYTYSYYCVCIIMAPPFSSWQLGRFWREYTRLRQTKRRAGRTWNTSSASFPPSTYACPTYRLKVAPR